AIYKFSYQHNYIIALFHCPFLCLQCVYKKSIDNLIVSPQMAMRDSIQAFHDVAYNQFLDKTDIILFLNKKDIFATKLKTTSITTCFPEYKGPDTMDSSLQYIQDRFLHNKPATKQMYTHICCAIDVPLMKDIVATTVECVVEINVKRLKHM
ncbi:hypothetical protein EGW08_008914, partial [Elysia chlorotica]